MTAATELSVAVGRDLIHVRMTVTASARAAQLGLVDQTKLVTAVSEIARNMLLHAGGGIVFVESVRESSRQGVRVVCADKGAGIPNLDLAMQDGFSTARSMGLGLPGAKRLVDEFDVSSIPGTGTKVIVVKWAR